MLENLYTTKMSANKKILQNRFTKIRSKSGRLSKIMAFIMSMAIAVTMLCATAVMAAVGNDGQEHWDKNEIYFVTGMKMSANVDLSTAPKWVENISDNGEIDIFLQRVNIRSTYGYVRHTYIVDLNGNISSLRFATTSSEHFTAVTDNELLTIDRSDNAPSIIIDLNNVNGELNENNIYVYFLTANMDIMHYIGDYKKDYGAIPFTHISDKTIEYIGNFKAIEKEYDYNDRYNYFTYFEKVYSNKNIDGFNISVLEATTNGIKVFVNIANHDADVLVCDVREKQKTLYADTGGTQVYKISDINNSGFIINKQRYVPGYFESGKEYVVDFVVKKDLSPNGMPVLYRQREYVTIR